VGDRGRPELPLSIQREGLVLKASRRRLLSLLRGSFDRARGCASPTKTVDPSAGYGFLGVAR